MTKVLCFGDSNTWGTKPEGGRYADHERWSFLLGVYLNMSSSDSINQEIESKYLVMEAGQPNRTLINNAPFDGDKSGLTYLKPLLAIHEPELVIIMLGTNDLKAKFNLSPTDIGEGAGTLIKQIQAFSQEAIASVSNIKILLVSPPEIKECPPYISVYAGGAQKSQLLAHEFTAQAELYQCDFLDANQVIKSSDLDGIHWDAQAHESLALSIAEYIKQRMPFSQSSN